MSILAMNKDSNWHYSVYLLVKLKYTPKQIAEIKKCTSLEILRSIERNKKFTNWYDSIIHERPICLGHKDEPYMTEGEMLKGFQIDFEGLSESEKQLYFNH